MKVPENLQLNDNDVVMYLGAQAWGLLKANAEIQRLRDFIKTLPDPAEEPSGEVVPFVKES